MSVETFFHDEPEMSHRAVIRYHLEQAEQDVEQAALELARQRALVTALDDSSALSRAERTLLQLEEAQSAYIADRNRLRAEFAALEDTD